jgi:NADH-quinone oxidoreductase subunit H
MAIFPEYILPILTIVFKGLLILVPLLLAIAYLTYAERRVIGLMQQRTGPNVVGPFGLLQPIADAIKLIFKETIIPTKANSIIFIIAPILTFVLSLLGWVVIPFSDQGAMANINVGILYILAASSLGVYGIIMAGWSSNSKYAFLGAIRSSAQMISYEVSIGLVLVNVLLTTGSLNISTIIESQRTMPLWIQLMMLPMTVIFFISVLAETNRLPFDLPEAESELVAGYNVEYSSMSFALFFLGEYANMILVSSITATLFMGGYLPPFGITFLELIPGSVWFILKIVFLLFVFLWLRATLPRYRYDQLMRIGWKLFLPISLFWVILMASLLMLTDNLPA